MIFSVGDKVEVVMKEQVYKGSYNSGVVTRIEEDRDVVTFHNFINKNGAILQHMSHLDHLRPCPPEAMFKLKDRDVVDTRYHNGRWLDRIYGEERKHLCFSQ